MEYRLGYTIIHIRAEISKMLAKKKKILHSVRFYDQTPNYVVYDVVL